MRGLSRTGFPSLPLLAELARRIGRDPSSIRRLFTAQANPELLLVASIAEDLGAEVRIVPRPTGRRRKAAA